jgi:5-methyltetrahydrofolate--homocysteine methyltransferase
MPIINPLDGEMCRAINAYRVLSGEDVGAEDYIARFGNSESVQVAKNEVDMTLYDAVKRGLSSSVERLTLAKLETEPPMDIINNTLIRALGEVGELYGKGKIFLPQLISSAEAAKLAFSVITKKLPQDSAKRGKVVLATVKGDVHDIGKNIVKVVLQSYGFEVIDLGKDVGAEAVVAACEKHSPLAVGLSALMTTTVISMENTVSALRNAGVKTPIFVGGAVLTPDIAREIGADYYSSDALEFVKILESII